MPPGAVPKNIIVQMADRLRAGQAGAARDRARQPARDSFESRAHVLKTLAERSAALAADARFAGVKVIARPDRMHLRHGTRIVTVRISPEIDHFSVSGSRLGSKFSANPAHLQEGAAVLIVIDDAGGSGYGAEVGARELLEDLIRS